MPFSRDWEMQCHFWLLGMTQLILEVNKGEIYMAMC